MRAHEGASSEKICAITSRRTLSSNDPLRTRRSGAPSRTLKIGLAQFAQKTRPLPGEER